MDSEFCKSIEKTFSALISLVKSLTLNLRKILKKKSRFMEIAGST